MTPSVYWLIQNLTAVPANDDWLTADERARLEKMRFPKRRADWRLGRWTAKRALAAYFQQAKQGWCAKYAENSGLPEAPIRLRWIEIRTAADGAPEAFAKDRPVPATISISHRDEVGFCTIHPFRLALGCDVERVEPHSKNFVEDYFNDEEQKLVAQVPEQERHLSATLIWSAKESALKALRQGLRRDTRSVLVEVRQADNLPLVWNPITVHCLETERTFRGWWRMEGDYVQTTLTDHSMAQPVEVRIH
jgi:4'-phosphopantetheinyl transferase